MKEKYTDQMLKGEKLLILNDIIDNLKKDTSITLSDFAYVLVQNFDKKDRKSLIRSLKNE